MIHKFFLETSMNLNQTFLYFFLSFIKNYTYKNYFKIDYPSFLKLKNLEFTVFYKLNNSIPCYEETSSLKTQIECSKFFITIIKKNIQAKHYEYVKLLFKLCINLIVNIEYIIKDRNS